MTNPIQDKKIVLGVTGSVAAYKAVELASRLHQSGSLVDVILTQSANHFISPLAFQSVTSRKAYIDDDLWRGEGHVIHINLAHMADILVIAPSSANTIAKLAQGICDNLLTVTALAAKCPIILAPAMDAGMYSHAATQANIDTLINRGLHIIPPCSGHLASGLTGLGRMEEPSIIYNTIRKVMGSNGQLVGTHIVVTAGATQEAIDPVRFITNHSSGKQGYAIAQAAIDAGADVTLISGPNHLDSIIGAKHINIKTADELCQAVLSEIEQADVLIMAAAPADFRPLTIESQKIKKNSDFQAIKLQQTEDILRSVAQKRALSGHPKKVIGFAAESFSLIENAKKKLHEKKLDLIVANDITLDNAGFQASTNKVNLIFADGRQEKLPLMGKYEVADHIINQIIYWFTHTGQ